MSKKNTKKDVCPVTADGVAKAIASFKEIGEVNDANRDLKYLDPQARAIIRRQNNLEFRARIMDEYHEPAKKGTLTELQKEALKAAAILGTTSMADFAFCAKITVARLKAALKNDPYLEKQLAFLSQTTTLAAKRNLISAIEDGDLSISQWWLERHPESEMNPNNSKKQQEAPLVIIMPAEGKQPVVEGEIVREELDADKRGETLALASESVE